MWYVFPKVRSQEDELSSRRSARLFGARSCFCASTPTATAICAATLRMKWLGSLGTGTLYIEPRGPWENGYCESFNGKLRDECLNGEIFYSLKEAQVVIEKRRVEYDTRRPHSPPGFSAHGFTA